MCFAQEGVVGRGWQVTRLNVILTLQGSLLYAALCALSFFYMAAAWGGYIFIFNLIPLHVIVLLSCGRYSDR